MKKQFHYYVLHVVCIILILATIFVSVGCENNNVNEGILQPVSNNEQSFDWDNVEFIPSSGYICAFNKGEGENGPTMLQLPFTTSNNSPTSTEELSEIILKGETAYLKCSNYKISLPDANASDFGLLRFFVDLHEIGKYSVSSIVLKWSDGKETIKPIGEYIFSVKDAEKEPTLKTELKLRGSPGPRTDYGFYILQYENVSKEDICITDMEYDDRLYSKIYSISCYKENRNPRNDTVIKPGEQIYVRFDMKIRPEIHIPLFFYQFSPSLTYTIGEKQKEMIAVYSPMIIQASQQ